jgi:hypothetical protein
MKRIAVLLVVLLAGLSLYGCGAKGTTASSNGSSSTSNPGGGSQPGPITTFTLNLVDKDNVSRIVNAGTGTTATDVRVVIRRYDTVPTSVTTCTQFTFDSNGDSTCIATTTTIVNTFTEVYKDIQDVPFSSSISVGIPAGSGYTLDVITSVLTTPSNAHSILKYGQAPSVTVTGSGSASVTMNSVPAILNMSVTDPATSKGKYVVTLNDVLPFNPAYQLTVTFIGINDPVTQATVTPMLLSSSTNTTTITAPASYSNAGTIGLQAQFTLNNAFLNSGETTAKWTRIFPDAAYGESVSSTFNPLIPVTIGL